MKLILLIKYLLIILYFFLISCSCKKENAQYQINCDKPTNDVNISRNIFQGKWTWVSEYYVQPFSGNIYYKTPLTEGYTRQLLVSNNSILDFFKNKISQQRYQYDFVIEKSITGFVDDTANVLVFKDYSTGVRSSYVNYKICDDTLTLNFQITTDTKGKEKWVKNN